METQARFLPKEGKPSQEFTPEIIVWDDLSSNMQALLQGQGWRSELATEDSPMRRINHVDGSQTYCAEWGNRSEHNDKEPYFVNHHIEVIDVVDKQYAGEGEVVFTTHHNGYPGTLEHPIVTMMRNAGAEDDEPKFARRGLAERRYMILNQLAKEIAGKAIRSGVMIGHSSKVWEKLVTRGLAEVISNGAILGKIFRFKE